MERFGFLYRTIDGTIWRYVRAVSRDRHAFRAGRTRHRLLRRRDIVNRQRFLAA